MFADEGRECAGEGQLVAETKFVVDGGEITDDDLEIARECRLAADSELVDDDGGEISDKAAEIADNGLLVAASEIDEESAGVAVNKA